MSSSIDEAISAVLRLICKHDVTSVDVDRAQRRAEAVGHNFRDPASASDLKRLITDVLTLRREPNAIDRSALIEKLSSRGWRHSAEVLYLQFLATLADRDLRQLVSLAPTQKALVGLCGKVPAAKKELETLIASDPQTSATSPIADWALLNGKLEKTETLFLIMLRLEKRADGLRTPDELLRVAVQRDKKSVLLKFAVSQCHDDDFALHRLARAVLKSPKIASQYAEQMQSPKLLKTYESGVINFVHALCSAAIVENEKRVEFRTTASLTLVRLIAGALILHPKDKPQPMYVNKALFALGDLERAADSESTKSHTWVLRTLAETVAQPTGAALIGARAARIVKITFDNADSSSNPVALLEAMAFNLGMTVLEEPGARVAYEPIRHEDTVGGLLPGDHVVVLRKGWSLGDAPVIRAKVKPAE